MAGSISTNLPPKPVDRAQRSEAPRWMAITLILAAVYNLAWGAWVILRPDDLFDLAGIDPPNYPGIWQCVGMIVGVYGIGYAVAAIDPLRHWPITLVGFLGKIFGPIGFFFPILFGDPETPGQLPLSWGWTIVTNDLIWWVPFGAILYLAFKRYNQPDSTAQLPIADANRKFRSQHGRTIDSVSKESTVMVMFLRHSGCTFCREALADLARQQDELASRNVVPFIVHMGDNEDQAGFFDSYGLGEVDRISDPDCVLYRAYQIPRGKLGQLFGWKVWRRGFVAAILRGHGVGKLGGDGFQLGGTFLVRDNAIIAGRSSETAADHVDVCQLGPATT